MSSKRKSSAPSWALLLLAVLCAGIISAGEVITEPRAEPRAEPTAELRLFRAEYIAKYQGLPIKAKGIRELKRTRTGDYHMVSSADSMLAQVNESTRFALRDGKVRPDWYQYERTGIGKNKLESGHFDWEEMHHLADDQATLLVDLTLDKLSYQIQLRLDVARAIEESGFQGQVFTYLVADQEKRRTYTFQITGQETLNTPMGNLPTVRLERVRENQRDGKADSKRRTQLWLATEHDYLLVRLKQEDRGKGFELNLSQFVWRTQTPLAETAEYTSSAR
ncbi:MAG: hypothetical protein ACI8Z1_002512 [Candidatus Azotimanducaceae bacterium]|jgi:hypothetical protein